MLKKVLPKRIARGMNKVTSYSPKKFCGLLKKCYVCLTTQRKWKF